MKQDWSVKGTVAYVDRSLEGYDAAWPGLTMEEVDEKMDELASEYIAKRKVHGISITATARGAGGVSLIQRVQWK